MGSPPPAAANPYASTVTTIEHTLDTPAGSVFAGPRRRVSAILLRLAWPVMAERVALTVLAAIDALLAGRYVGPEGVAAVGTGAIWLWLALAGAAGAETGAMALVAREVGAGKPRAALEAARAALGVSLLWGVGAALFFSTTAPLLMRLIGVEAGTAHHGVAYLRTAAWALPFLVVMHATAGALRGMGDTLRPMVALIAFNSVSLAVSFSLISGVFGISLGVRASGIGFTAAAACGAAITLLFLVKGRGPMRLPLRALFQRPDREAVRRFVRLALPVTLDEVQFLVAFLVYTRIIAASGTTAVAAHTIAMRIIDSVVVPGFALGVAATTLTGQALGMGRPDLAERTGRSALLTGILIQVVGGGLLVLLGPSLCRLFVEDPTVVSTASTLLRIFALALPGIGVLSAVAGVLRGAGDVRFVLLLTTIATWGLRVPIAFVGAVVLGWGAPGAWMGAVFDNTTRGLLAYGRFRSGRWKQIRV